MRLCDSWTSEGEAVWIHCLGAGLHQFREELDDNFVSILFLFCWVRMVDIIYFAVVKLATYAEKRRAVVRFHMTLL